MASQKTKFAVGLFVATGIGVASLAIIWLGMSRYLEKGQYYVSYFNESVQGLDIDAPVKYRGVAIGRVDSIGVAPDAKLIEVVLKIESGQPLQSDLVAQLKSVGITGIMFVELDRKKEGELDRSPPLSFPAKHPVVASKPSGISELLKGIDDALKQIRSLDLEGISDSIKSTLESVSQAVSDADIKGISHNLKLNLDNIGRIVTSAGNILDYQRLDKIMASVEEAGQSLNSLMDKANRSLDSVENTFARVEGVVTEKEETIKTAIDEFRGAMENASSFLSKGSALVSGTNDTLSYLRRNLLVTSQNLEKASQNLDRLIELIADHPSQLLFGEPPLPRKVEPEPYESE